MFFFFLSVIDIVIEIFNYLILTIQKCIITNKYTKAPFLAIVFGYFVSLIKHF